MLRVFVGRIHAACWHISGIDGRDGRATREVGSSWLGKAHGTPIVGVPGLRLPAMDIWAGRPKKELAG